MLGKNAGELLHRSGIAFVDDDERLDCFAPTLRNRRFTVLPETHQLTLAVSRRRLRGGDRCYEVMAHRVAKTKVGAVIPSEHETTRRGLLVRGCDGAVEQRPARAVAWIERIVHFAGEIKKPKLVEPLRVVAPVEVESFALRRRDVRVVRPRFRGEVVRRVATHFVEIDEDLREPLLVCACVTSGLGLSQREPVTVQVEIIMIGASSRPGLVVLGCGGMSRGSDPFGDAKVVDETVTPVRVLRGHEDDETVLKDGVDDVVVLCGEEVVGQCRGSRRETRSRCRGRRRLAT